MISVDQLVAVPSLGLRYLAGERGGARLVTGRTPVILRTRGHRSTPVTW